MYEICFFCLNPILYGKMIDRNSFLTQTISMNLAVILAIDRKIQLFLSIFKIKEWVINFGPPYTMMVLIVGLISRIFSLCLKTFLSFLR